MLDHHFEILKVNSKFLSGLNEDYIQLILKQCNSKLCTYEISPGIYTFKDHSEILSTGF